MLAGIHYRDTISFRKPDNQQIRRKGKRLD